MIWLATFIAASAVVAAIVLDFHKPKAFRPWLCTEWRNGAIAVAVMASAWVVGLVAEATTWQHAAALVIAASVLAIVIAGAVVAVSEVLRTRGGRH